MTISVVIEFFMHQCSDDSFPQQTIFDPLATEIRNDYLHFNFQITMTPPKHQKRVK